MIPIAYLASRYPAVSHTFILNEVRRLRALGLAIDVASINEPDRAPEALTAEEREEAAAAYCVKRAGVAGALAAHAAILLRHPIRYVRGLAAAVSLGGADARRLLLSLAYFTEALLVGRWMSRHGARHLHVHFANPAATVGVLVRRVFPVTLSITIHGPDEFHDAPGSHLARKIRDADFLCCISRFAASQIRLHGPPACDGKIEINRMGVDAARFAPVERPRRGPPFELLCVGRLTPAKGQHVLVAAVGALAAGGRDVRLRLVGDGPDRAGLERDVAARGLSGRAVFEGAVNHDRIAGFHATADAFVLASFAEGVPVVLMEAMAAEIPCVATSIAGIPELIRDGEDGLLVPPSDAAGLEAAIARLMDEPDLARRLGRAGRRHVLAEYELSRNTAELAAIFRRRLAALHPGTDTPLPSGAPAAPGAPGAG